MTIKGGTTQACAACKYQRKRCTPECALAPHFRPEHTEIFKNAHRLFGVKNILKILEQVEPAKKTDAMRSIIYQANMRERFPVHGCLWIIYQLQYHLRLAEKELYSVLSQLKFYRQNEIPLSPLDSPESKQLQLGICIEQPAGNPALTLFQHEIVNHGHIDPPHDQQFLPVGYRNPSIHIENINSGDVMWPGSYCNEISDHDSSLLHPQFVNMQPLPIQEEVTHDYDDIYPFFHTIDDTQSYIDSKEANESRYVRSI